MSSKATKGAVALLILSLSLLSLLVKKGVTTDFDKAGVSTFRTSVDMALPFDESFVIACWRFITHFGDSLTLALLVVIATALIWWKGKKLEARWFFICASGSFIITAIGKALFGRERPDLIERFVEASSASYPSGHTLRSAVVYALIAVIISQSTFSERAKYCLITMISLLILINGLSRVYLGVHWPTDIIGAWLSAGIWVLSCKLGYEAQRT